MRRLVLASALAAAAIPLSAGPAAATCMQHYHDPRTQLSVTSCAAPGGPVTTTYCVRDVCYSTTSGDPGGWQ